MKHKDLDSRNRYQKAWDAMMLNQKTDQTTPEELNPPKQPDDDNTFFFWMCFMLGLVIGFGLGALFLAVLKGWLG